MLCWFVDCFSILWHCFTLDVAHWFRRQALWTAICPISGSGSPPAYCQSICLSRLCLLKVPMGIRSLPFPLSPVLSVHPAPSAACSLFIIQVFFCRVGEGQFVQGAVLVCPRGSCGNTVCCLFAHLLVCISQSGFADIWWRRSPPVFSV
jgi:hypothetical protein